MSCTGVCFDSCHRGGTGECFVDTGYQKIEDRRQKIEGSLDCQEVQASTISWGTLCTSYMYGTT
jgi:hypothetical protein